MSKCLLSPQHVATACDMCDTDTTGCYTGATTTTFTFGPKGENALTVQHNLLTKVPEIKATPSCKTFHAYASNVDQQAHTYKLKTYCSSPCTMPSTTPTHDNIPAVISLMTKTMTQHLRYNNLHHRAKDDPVTTVTLVQNPYFNTTTTMLGIICSSQIGHRRLRNSKMCTPLQTARENYFSFIINMGIFLSTNSRSWQRHQESSHKDKQNVIHLNVLPACLESSRKEHGDPKHRQRKSSLLLDQDNM